MGKRERMRRTQRDERSGWGKACAACAAPLPSSSGPRPAGGRWGMVGTAGARRRGAARRRPYKAVGRPGGGPLLCAGGPELVGSHGRPLSRRLHGDFREPSGSHQGAFRKPSGSLQEAAGSRNHHQELLLPPTAPRSTIRYEPSGRATLLALLPAAHTSVPLTKALRNFIWWTSEGE